MPCMKCSNGKWKYGEHGNCQFDTLEQCQAAAAAIHINDTIAAAPEDKTEMTSEYLDITNWGVGRVDKCK